MAEIEHVLTLAIGAAGQRDDPSEWRKRILAAAQDIAGMLNEHSVEWFATQRVLQPDGVFIAIYDGYTFEERSQRCILQFRDKDTGQLETKKGQPVVTRTDRCDSPLGALMRERLDAIPKGATVRVWKALEAFKKDGDDAKFRVLAHIEPMSKRDDDTRSQGSASPTREPERVEPAGSGESYPGPAGDRPFGSLVEKALATMRAPQRVNFIRHLAVEHKITGSDFLLPKYESEVLAAMEKFNGA